MSHHTNNFLLRNREMRKEASNTFDVLADASDSFKV